MFDHTCTECERRVLIFPSQVTSLVNTDHAIIVAFTCWCGAEQTHGHRPGPPGARRRLILLSSCSTTNAPVVT